MIDPRPELAAAMRAALKADLALGTLFGPGKPVRVYDIPPVNAALGDYFVIGEDDLAPDQAECMEGAEIHATVHVWSLTSPPGLARARLLAAAAAPVLLALGSLPSHRIDDAQVVPPSRTAPDADGQTAHGLLTIRFNTVPL